MDIIDGKSFASGEDEQRLFFERQREFSFKLLKTTNKCKKKDNVILSPYSIDRVLLMSYFGAANETKISLEKLLCLKNADKETVARSFRSKPNDDRHVEFVSADKCFVSNRIELNGPIKNLFKEDIETYIEKMDFENNTENSRIAINNFIENTTKHEIKNMIRQEHIQKNTLMVLVNAAYFKDFWRVPFSEDKTKTEVFHGLKDTMVEMMHNKYYHFYTINYSMQFKALRLAFKSDFSIYFFLPFKIISNIDIFLSRFSRKNFDKTVEKLNHCYNLEVDVKLPKMSFEQELFDMRKILEKMGAKNLFCDESPDFSDFTKGLPLGVSEILHKAKIEVTENGTTAAAAVAVCIKRAVCYRSNQYVPTFHCNRPFVFIIHNKQRNAILFSGIFRGSN